MLNNKVQNNNILVFPIRRKVLLEKNSIDQLVHVFEQELTDCCVYKYNSSTKDIVFYIKNNVVLLEAQLYDKGYFYISHKLSNFSNNDTNVEEEIKIFLYLKYSNIHTEINDYKKMGVWYNDIGDASWYVSNSIKIL